MPTSSSPRPSAQPVHPAPFVAERHPVALADPLPLLRSATAAQHAQLDAQLAIARPGASLADYGAHVQALAGWLQALHPHLQTLASTVPDFDFTPPQRLAALQADLRDLAEGAHPQAPAGPGPHAAAGDLAAQALAAHRAQAPAVCWGMAYVVEGSQLGGQVLHRRLAGPLAPHPLRYLRGDGAATGARWTQFLSLLRTHVGSPAQVAAACSGATAAFAAMQGLCTPALSEASA